MCEGCKRAWAGTSSRPRAPPQKRRSESTLVVRSPTRVPRADSGAGRGQFSISALCPHRQMRAAGGAAAAAATAAAVSRSRSRSQPQPQSAAAAAASVVRDP